MARIFDNSGSVVKVFASTTNFVAQAQIATNKVDYGKDVGKVAQSNFGKRTVWIADGKGGLVASQEDYQTTELEKVSIAGGLFAAPVDALSALKDAVKGVINWGKHLAGAEEHGNLAREGVGVVHSFGKAAKAALAVAFKVKDFFEGAGASQALEVLPGMGLALNAIEIMKRSIDIHRARKDAVTVKAGKAAGKQDLLERGGWDDLKKLDRHKIRARRAQLEQLRDKATFPKDRVEAEQQLAVIDEYFLDRDLLNTANKRRDRGTVAIVKECQALVGNIATLAGRSREPGVQAQQHCHGPGRHRYAEAQAGRPERRMEGIQQEQDDREEEPPLHGDRRASVRRLRERRGRLRPNALGFGEAGHKDRLPIRESPTGEGVRSIRCQGRLSSDKHLVAG